MKLMTRLERDDASTDEPEIQISEQDGCRYLHLGSKAVQSAMRIAAPDELLLGYTQCMMAFLLFKPDPARVTLIGLGGGSLAKFIYRQLPETVTVCVESDPRIVRVAHQQFALPLDTLRLPIIVADGLEFITRCTEPSDVILVDGFSRDGPAEQLYTVEFYQRARVHLGEGGVLAVNLWRNSPNFSEFVARIQNGFDAPVYLLPDPRKGNTIAFALKSPTRRLSTDTWWKQAQRWSHIQGFPLQQLAERLIDENVLLQEALVESKT